MKAIRVALSAVATLALAGCASLQVRTDYDPQVSFAQLRTYDLTNQVDAGGNPTVNNRFVERRIHLAVDSTLERMGYQRVTTGTPDFRLTYRIAAERTTRVDRGYSYGYGYGSHYGHGFLGHGRFGHGSFGHGRFGRSHHGLGYGPYYGSSRVREYTRATFVLDVVDTRTNELIWRGWAEKTLAHNPNPKAVQKYVSEAVEKILEEFPPPSLGPQPRHIVS